MFRNSPRQSGVLFGISALSLVFAVAACKLIGEKGKIRAFTAESSAHFEYLVEKIVTVENPVSSGYLPMGNASRLDRSAPGSSQMLSQSLDSIGICYWYAKYPKTSVIDGGLPLDFPDGTPNMGVRNNIIARAGVPLTANAISMGEVLLSMREAGGELASLEQKVSEGTVKLHEVLWNSAGAAGIATSALAASNTGLAAKLSSDAKLTTSGIMSRLTGSGSVASAGLSTGDTGRISTKILHASDPRLRTLANAYPGRWSSMLTDPTEYFQIGSTTIRGQGGAKQAVTYIVGKDGAQFFSATKPGDTKRAANYAFRRASNANKAALQGLGFTDQVMSAQILNAKVSSFKRLGIRNTVIPLRATARNATAATQKVVAGAAQAGKSGVSNVLSFCKGSAKKVAICGATLGTLYAGTHWAFAAANQAQIAFNEDNMSARMESILSNPQAQQNFSAVITELEKNTKISPELMDSFRKILAIKSSRSRLGSCSQIFGTELLTTPGVAESGYNPDSVSNSASDVTSFDMPSTPPIEETALQDIPEFVPPVEGDPSDIHTISDDLSVDAALPSEEISGLEGSSTDPSLNVQPGTSSDEFGPSSN